MIPRYTAVTGALLYVAVNETVFRTRFVASKTVISTCRTS